METKNAGSPGAAAYPPPHRLQNAGQRHQKALGSGLRHRIGRELPKELYDILEEKKTESFKLTYEEDDRLYLCVGYGQQESGGYSIAVNDLYLTENAIYFDTSLIGPGPEEAKGEVSYPYLTVQTKYLDKPVVFQ